MTFPKKTPCAAPIPAVVSGSRTKRRTVHGGKHEQMTGGRAKSKGASSGVLFVRSLNLLYILKRYVGGLVWFDGSDCLCIVSSRGLCASGGSDDGDVSFTVFVGFRYLRGTGKHRNTVRRFTREGKRCAAVSNVKDTRPANWFWVSALDWGASAFQLESLILAQNERWRQA